MQQELLDLAGQVRERRRVLKITQEDLASLAGCSARFVRAVEGAKPTLRLDKLLALLDALGLTLTATLRRPR